MAALYFLLVDNCVGPASCQAVSAVMRSGAMVYFAYHLTMRKKPFLISRLRHTFRCRLATLSPAPAAKFSMASAPPAESALFPAWRAIPAAFDAP